MKIKNPRTPIIFYIIIALSFVMLLNTFILPTIIKKQIIQVDYGTFLKMIENNQVENVQVDETQIHFSGIDEEGNKQVYVTGKMEDPKLADRLYEAEVDTFSRVIPQEVSPIINFLLSWVLPFAILFAIGRMFTNRMMSKMGGMGNAMSFGKSKAKIYVEAQSTLLLHFRL